MKLLSAIAVGLLALGAAHTVSAQTVIRFTGSTAFRSQTHQAIQNVLAPGYTFGFTGTTIGGANAAIFKGTFNGSPVTIKTSWSGSVGGIQTVAAASPIKTVGVFPDGESTSAAGISGKADPRQGAIQERPDIAMGDNSQSSTRFNGTFLGVAYANLLNATINTLNPPAASPVGVVPFQFVTSESGTVYGTLNMTTQTANALYGGLGAAPLALWTGNPAHQTVTVYAAGRDPDSGTRLVAFAETGIGVNATVQQFRPTVSGGMITSVALYPATTINGVPVPAGESGESSGGTLASLLGNPGPPASAPFGAGFMMTYVGIPDATTLIAGGGAAMTYNGVAYSDQAIREGQYTFWGYERLLYRSGTTGITKAYADAVATNIYDVTAPLKLSTMNVQRSVDGGIVTAIYF